MIEEWKVYKTSKSNRFGTIIYEVSNLGNVKRNGKLVKPICRHGEYPHIGGFMIHRAVAELFIPNTEKKPWVDHIDTNKYNNKIYNLRWVTPQENNDNPISKERRIKALKGRKMPDNFGEIQSKLKIQLYKDHPEIKVKLSESHKGLPSCNKGKTGLFNHTEETKQKLREKFVGENNPMFGKKLKDYMTEEAYENWKNNLKGRTPWNEGLHTRSGEKNPMYGKGLRIWVNNMKENHLIKISEKDNYLNNGYYLGRK